MGNSDQKSHSMPNPGEHLPFKAATEQLAVRWVPSPDFPVEDGTPLSFNPATFFGAKYLPRALDKFLAESPWYSMDTEDRYTYNSKKYPGKMVYSEKDIWYSLNSYGYRSVEPFSDKNGPSVVYLGCSYTQGVGLPVHDIWPTLLHSKIEEHMGAKLACHNLGVCGASNDNIARRVLSIGVLNPVLVVVLYSFNYRREFITIPGGFVSTSSSPWCPQAKSIMELGDFSNDTHNFLKNKAIVELAAEKSSCPMLSTSIDPVVLASNGFKGGPYFFLREDPERGDHPQARDMVHPGKLFHKILAEEFFEQISRRGILDKIK